MVVGDKEVGQVPITQPTPQNMVGVVVVQEVTVLEGMEVGQYMAQGEEQAAVELEIMVA